MTTATARRTILRHAYTINPTDRIVLDGDEVTVTDVQRDYTRRHVTLTTSYGAPRTVTWDARVPHVLPETESSAAWRLEDAARRKARAAARKTRKR